MQQSTAEKFTHEEIWDDSALVDSWNQALDEYKRYHSIHAKGGSLNDILESPPGPTQDQNAKPETGREGDVPGVDERERDEGKDLETPARGQDTNAQQFDSRAGPHYDVGRTTLDGPQLLLGNVQDGELKNLLMSWYWAGYYTATYQARQKEEAQKNGPK